MDGAGGWELGFFPLMRLVLLSILVLHNYTPLAPMLAAGDACLANLIFFKFGILKKLRQFDCLHTLKRDTNAASIH